MDANRGKGKVRPANSVRRTRTPEGTLPPAEMRRASDRKRQASHPKYGARHEMTFGTSATARGNLGCPAAREAVAQGPLPHSWQAQVCREVAMRERGGEVPEASIRTRTKARHRQPFRLVREGTGSRPTCCTRCFGVEMRSTAACPAKEQKGRVDREVAGSGRGQTLKGEIPWMSSG